MKNFMGCDVCSAIVAVLMTGGGPAGWGQVHASESPAPQTQQAPGRTVPANEAAGQVAAASAGTGDLGASRVFDYGAMAVRSSASGESRNITHGVLATGETVNLHESMQIVGAAPVALHVIRHSEFVCVSEGELEFQHEVDGKVVAEKVGAGGVIYVAFGTNHRVVNTGKVPAKYFVIAIGGDAK